MKALTGKPIRPPKRAPGARRRKSRKGIVTSKRRSRLQVSLARWKRQAWNVLGGLGLMVIVLWLASLVINY